MGDLVGAVDSGPGFGVETDPATGISVQAGSVAQSPDVGFGGSAITGGLPGATATAATTATGVTPVPGVVSPTSGVGGVNTGVQSELEQISLEIARRQLSAIDAQTAQQQTGFDDISKLLSTLEASAAADSARQQELQPIIDEITQIQLQNLRQGTAATPEQITQIDKAISSALELGKSDISAGAQESLRLLREQLAPSLGLRPGDSPILDRGALVARESVRQQGQLVRGLEGQRAQALLNFPLAAQNLTNQTAQFTAGLATQQQAFRANLQQQAVQNRLSASQTFGNLGLGLAGQQPAGAGLALGIGQQQTGLGIAQIGADAQVRAAQLGADAGSAGSTLGGIGGLLLGLGSFF